MWKCKTLLGLNKNQEVQSPWRECHCILETLPCLVVKDFYGSKHKALDYIFINVHPCIRVVLNLLGPRLLSLWTASSRVVCRVASWNSCG